LLEISGDAVDSETTIAHQVLGSSLDELQQVQPALAHLLIARAANPARPEIYQTLGYVLRRANQLDRALETFKVGLQLAPDHLDLLVNLAATSIECGRTDDALALVGRLEAAAPGHPVAVQLRQLAHESANTAPPVLVPRVVPPDNGITIVCDVCE